MKPQYHMPIGLEDESMAAITAKRRRRMFFDANKPKVRRLEPKWNSHFGNYIDNTLLALRKFQAKKQISQVARSKQKLLEPLPVGSLRQMTM
jgi:hypothetical protein